MEDRLSFLPREIRDHIISFLPTQNAIQTSILSSRWKNVCSTLSHLVFIQCYHSTNPDEEKFIEYVNHTVSRHDNTNVDVFWLLLDVVDSGNFLHRLNDWFSFAASHNARDIFLSVQYAGLVKPINLPLCLSTSNNSLKELSLDNIDLTLSTNIKFPNLTSLTLCGVELFDVSVINQLLSSSTVLETLTIIQCSCQNPFDILVIPAPKLKLFVLQGSRHPFHEIQHVSTNLYKMLYRGPPNFYINPSSSLKVVKLNLPGISDATNPWASKIIKSLCNVVNLSLGGSFFEFLANEGRALLSRLRTSCCSLENLSLSLYARKGQVRVMMLLLRRFPRLQTLYIHVKKNGKAGDSLINEEYWETEEFHTDNYVVEQLKTVEIEECRESEIELDMVRHLLENGPAMERMDITLSRQGALNLTNFCEKIHKCARASPLVTVSVSPLDPMKLRNPPGYLCDL